MAQGAAYGRQGLDARRYESDMKKRVLTLVNATNITPRTSISGSAGPEAADPLAGCTSSSTQLRNATRRVARDGARGGGSRDQWPARVRHVGADLRRPGGKAGPSVLTVGGEAGAGQDHRGVVALRANSSVLACGSGGPQRRDSLYDKMAGAESQTLSPASISVSSWVAL